MIQLADSYVNLLHLLGPSDRGITRDSATWASDNLLGRLLYIRVKDKPFSVTDFQVSLLGKYFWDSWHHGIDVEIVILLPIQVKFSGILFSSRNIHLEFLKQYKPIHNRRVY